MSSKAKVKCYNYKDGNLYEAARRTILSKMAKLEEEGMEYHISYEICKNTLKLYREYMNNPEMTFAKAEFILDSDHSSYCWIGEDKSGNLTFHIKSRKQGYHDIYHIGNPYIDNV